MFLWKEKCFLMLWVPLDISDKEYGVKPSFSPTFLLKGLTAGRKGKEREIGREGGDRKRRKSLCTMCTADDARCTLSF